VKVRRIVAAAVVAAVTVLPLAGCHPDGGGRSGAPRATNPTATIGVPAPAPEAGVEWTSTRVTGITDGDTIKTRKGKVRIIGIDTPERGECNYRAATEYLEALIPVGTEVRLGRVPTMADEDRYGRLVRYVDTTEGIDVGAELLQAGLAIARYDSRDGYGEHPREAGYLDLERSSGVIDCAA
jgi:endonuclease YncB( thermonuclease family)